MSTPSEQLTNHVINGWHVIEPVAVLPGQTGGTFSKGYIVEKNGKKAFLKAMDLHDALKKGLKEIERTTAQYNFERDLQSLCRDKRLSNIVKLLDDGEYDIDDTPSDVEVSFNKVYYMIFELADGGDIRKEINYDKLSSDSWKSFVLHQIAVALTQLHQVDIAHQDLKPSNVLSFRKLNKYKLSDLGRSSSKNHTAPTDCVPFPGDMNYAPPEYYYGFVPADHHNRRFGSDAYLLGSMISFLFCGFGAIGLTLYHLPQQYRPDEWKGEYEEVLPFLIDAHTKAVNVLSPSIPSKCRQEMTDIYLLLCHPDPRLRGHPVARSQHGKLIGLDRYVSRFDYMSKILAIDERKRRLT